jgi:hypothetical protein
MSDNPFYDPNSDRAQYLRASSYAVLSLGSRDVPGTPISPEKLSMAYEYVCGLLARTQEMVEYSPACAQAAALFGN